MVSTTSDITKREKRKDLLGAWLAAWLISTAIALVEVQFLATLFWNKSFENTFSVNIALKEKELQSSTALPIAGTIDAGTWLGVWVTSNFTAGYPKDASIILY